MGVKFIASQYKWNCPLCGITYIETEIPKDDEVKCNRCNKKFIVDDWYHMQQ